VIKKVIFVCAPGLPPLDMWLPVLASLREKITDAEFVFLAPKAGPIRHLDLSSILFTIAAPIFDKVIFPAQSGKWKQVNSLADAKSFFDAGPVANGGRLLKRLGLAPLLRAPVTIAFRVIKTVFRAKPKGECPLEALKDAKGVVLFDLFATDFFYASEVFAKLEQLPKFSMLHGLNVLGVGGKSDVVKSVFNSDNTIALLFSEREKPFYMNKYGLGGDQIRVVGIPRHQEWWIRKITSVSGEDQRALPKDYILVISRGSSDSTLPTPRKVSALRDVREAAAQHNLHVVVKRHPKEDDDGPYEEVFGSNNLGKTWSFSVAHPLVLGQYCSFAVSFYSGVVVDMVRIGVPVIEHLDMKGLPKDQLLRGNRIENQFGNLVSPYNHLGLVLGATDRSEFLSHVNTVLSHKEPTVRELKDRYHAVFPDADGIGDKVVLEIIETLANQDL